jgi:hypothetical protein
LGVLRADREVHDRALVEDALSAASAARGGHEEFLRILVEVAVAARPAGRDLVQVAPIVSRRR